MIYNLFFTILFILPISIYQQNIPHVVSPKYDLKDVKCLVCQSAVEEILTEVDKLNPDLKVEVGNYRLDSKGDIKQKTVSITKSETKLAEVLENICERFDNYAKATRKDTGELTILPMVTASGVMNPDISKVHMVQDDDLNKSLKHYCQSIMEEHDELIIEHLIKETPDLDLVICSTETKICPQVLDDNKEYYSPSENDEL